MKNISPLTKVKKILNLTFFAVFSAFAFLQLNDPDTILWFSIYASVALLFLISTFISIPKFILWLFLLAILIYAGFYFVYLLDWLQTDNKEEIFGEMVYEKPYLEGSREFLGLLIAAAALFYLVKNPVKVV